jgi:hypothetical protein
MLDCDWSSDVCSSDLVIEDKSNRAIRFGVVNAASMIFLPI